MSSDNAYWYRNDAPTSEPNDPDRVNINKRQVTRLDGSAGRYIDHHIVPKYKEAVWRALFTIINEFGIATAQDVR